MTIIPPTSLFRQDTQKLFLSVMFAVCLVSFFGTSGGNLSGSIGQSKGSSDRQWGDNASSIVGTESVDIDVDGKLKMEGSLIANIDKDGKDAGNLDIKAGSIEAKDLQNFDNNKETGFNLAESYGPPKDGSNDGHPNGTTTIGLKNKGYEKEGVTKATIGQGNIEVADGSDISGINRDIDNMDVITKDQITGALDATVTIDNRMFTEEGRKEILNDIENLPDNTVKVAQDISALPKQIQDIAVNTYKQAIKEIPNFTPDGVDEYTSEQFQFLIEKGILVSLEEEEEEEEFVPDKNKPIVVVSGKTEKRYIMGKDGNVYDVTDDYIEKSYVIEETLALVTASGKVVKYTYQGINGLMKFNDSLSQHVLERMYERGITKGQIKNTIEKPIAREPVKFDAQGRPSQKIIGRDATVAINPETGRVITVYKTGSKVLEKYGIVR